MRYSFILITACLFGIGARAQNFTHEATIKKINKGGLHKILLDATDKRYMTTNMRDVRIFDSAKKEVPYVVLSEPVLRTKSDFVEYPIVSQTHKKTHSEIVIDNPAKNKISNIAFNINNSDALKYCAVEGSDDMKQWYSVCESQELSLAYNSDYTNQYKCIYFPLNGYRYFRLLIDDWYAGPLKINSAGYFKNSVIAGKLNEVKFSHSREEVKKNTVLRLTFANNQQIDRIDFKTKEPRLFKRHARIYVNREQKRKHKIEKYQETLMEFELSSDKPLFFDVPSVNEIELFIEIENKDNPPLVIEDIQCKQLASYLICDLKENNSYVLKCGDKELNAPQYDLNYFVSDVPQLMPVAELGDMKEIAPAFIQSTEKTKSFYETKEFMWICIGAGIVIILLFSMSLLKDMAGKKEG